MYSNMRHLITAACAVSAVFAVAPASAADPAAMTAEARNAALTLQKTLAGKLLAEISAGGPESAIGVCETLAPAAAGEISREKGWRVTRVTLKVRNPLLGTPDPWEQRVLADFDARAARGETPDALELGEVVSEPQGKYFRYAKALPVIPLCTVCHGAPDSISAGVKERLANQYPHDRATGYGVGQIRGAISIKRPLD
jgi:hypothetical protein